MTNVEIKPMGNGISFVDYLGEILTEYGEDFAKMLCENKHPLCIDHCLSKSYLVVFNVDVSDLFSLFKYAWRVNIRVYIEGDVFILYLLFKLISLNDLIR